MSTNNTFTVLAEGAGAHVILGMCTETVLPPVWRQGLSLNLELSNAPRLVGQQAQGSSHL